jgi:hypothetical protein
MQNGRRNFRCGISDLGESLGYQVLTGAISGSVEPLAGGDQCEELGKGKVGGHMPRMSKPDEKRSGRFATTESGPMPCCYLEMDRSSGYEAVSAEVLEQRGGSTDRCAAIGVAVMNGVHLAEFTGIPRKEDDRAICPERELSGLSTRVMRRT